MKKLVWLVFISILSCQTVTEIIPTETPSASAERSCPEVKIDNRTDEPFNATDRWNLAIAKRRCKQLYKHSPCLVKFIKKAPGAYNGVCGEYDG